MWYDAAAWQLQQTWTKGSTSEQDSRGANSLGAGASNSAPRDGAATHKCVGGLVSAQVSYRENLRTNVRLACRAGGIYIIELAKCEFSYVIDLVVPPPLLLLRKMTYTMMNSALL